MKRNDPAAIPTPFPVAVRRPQSVTPTSLNRSSAIQAYNNCVLIVSMADVVLNRQALVAELRVEVEDFSADQ